eukprot:5188705-Pyramimonas_sp.AAC.1
MPYLQDLNAEHVMGYLGVIEQKTNEILQMYASSQAQLKGAEAHAGAALTVLGQGPQIPTGNGLMHIDPPSTVEEYTGVAMHIDPPSTVEEVHTHTPCHTPYTQYTDVAMHIDPLSTVEEVRTHTLLHPVTPCHTLSHPVTPCHTVYVHLAVRRVTASGPNLRGGMDTLRLRALKGGA